MQFVLTINTDNEAFDPDPRPEIARLLNLACNRITDALITAEPVTLLDGNGNTVGDYRWMQAAK